MKPIICFFLLLILTSLDAQSLIVYGASPGDAKYAITYDKSTECWKITWKYSLEKYSEFEINLKVLNLTKNAHRIYTVNVCGLLSANTTLIFLNKDSTFFDNPNDKITLESWGYSIKNNLQNSMAWDTTKKCWKLTMQRSMYTKVLVKTSLHREYTTFNGSTTLYLTKETKSNVIPKGGILIK